MYFKDKRKNKMLLEQKERILLADGTKPDVVIKCYDKDIFTHRFIHLS